MELAILKVVAWADIILCGALRVLRIGIPILAGMGIYWLFHRRKA